MECIRSAVELLKVSGIEVTGIEGHFRVGRGILRRGWSDGHKGKVLQVGGKDYERVEVGLVQLILH